MSQETYLSELFRIVNGALRLDIDKVRNYTAFLAEKLEKAGDLSSSSRLKKMLEESDHQLRPVEATSSRSLPVDAESRFPLIERIDIKRLSDSPLILSQDQWDTVNEFASVAKSYTQSDDSAISLLVYGPPGTGKSRLARYLAQDLGLDLYLARLDGLISSFLGSTSKNIRALFDYAARMPCILFLDEFDAIAKLRGDSQELGELKRVVNSFIQNLDSLGPQSIVIAATNHEELLDSAIWRRFSYRLALSFPTAKERHLMWVQFITPLQYSAKEIELLVDLSDGFTGSDIREVCTRLQRRRTVLHKEPNLPEALNVLRNLAIGEGSDRRFLARLLGQDADAVIAALRQRNPELYSHSAIAELLGVSKATAHRRAKGAKKDV